MLHDCDDSLLPLIHCNITLKGHFEAGNLLQVSPGYHLGVDTHLTVQDQNIPVPTAQKNKSPNVSSVWVNVPGGVRTISVR